MFNFITKYYLINYMSQIIHNNILSKYRTNNKILLYKNNLSKFISEQSNQIIELNNITELDYIIGILFLTETNRYFKNNKINIHCYYLAHTIINLFRKIQNYNVDSKLFSSDDITHFMYSLSYNIDYLNSRIDDNNIVKIKINNNLSKFIVNILPIFSLIEKTNNTDSIIVFSKFFYILLQTAQFLGSGNYYNPNLIRLAEYYAHIVTTFINCNKNTNNINNIIIYENYLNYKSKLNYSIIELNLISDTLEEIIKFWDNTITFVLSSKL